MRSLKVNVLDLVTCLFGMAPIFELFVVWCGSKNGHQEDMCSKEIDFMLNNFVKLVE